MRQPARPRPSPPASLGADDVGTAPLLDALRAGDRWPAPGLGWWCGRLLTATALPVACVRAAVRTGRAARAVRPAAGQRRSGRRRIQVRNFAGHRVPLRRRGHQRGHGDQAGAPSTRPAPAPRLRRLLSCLVPWCGCGQVYELSSGLATVACACCLTDLCTLAGALSAEPLEGQKERWGMAAGGGGGRGGGCFDARLALPWLAQDTTV